MKYTHILLRVNAHTRIELWSSLKETTELALDFTYTQLALQSYFFVRLFLNQHPLITFDLLASAVTAAFAKL